MAMVFRIARCVLQAVGSWLWLVSFLLGAPTSVQASPLPAAVPLADTVSVHALANRSQFLLDPGGQLSADDIEARQDQLPFAVRPEGHRLLLPDDAALWIRFVARVNGRGERWLLQVGYSGVDEATLYYRDGAGALVTQRAGDSLPQSAWAERGRTPFFALSPESGREVTYLLRIRHERVRFSGPLFLLSQTAASEQEQRVQFILGAYFGLAGLAIFVALANALVYRDRGFGSYAAYVLTMVLGQAGLTGVGGMLFWPEIPGLSNPMTFFMPVLAGALGVWFVRIVATPQQHSMLLDRVSVAMILALVAMAGFDAMRPTVLGFELSMYLLALSMVVVTALLGLSVARGDRHSRWIAAGFALVVLGGVFPVARSIGLIPSGFLSEYGLMLGSALEMPLLFYGLNRRLNVQTETRARARALAVTDPLTGLTSHRRLLVQLQALLNRASATRPFALMVVEMANHGALAREIGREGGDRALVLAASRLRRVVRDADIVARVGAQHFAVLMQSPCSLDCANAMATHVVAQGLRRSEVLPPGSSLRFHVALGLLPMVDLDAEATLDVLLAELKAITLDARKTIRVVKR
jgi:diguanylate cyclase (GGDEF)-like protein